MENLGVERKLEGKNREVLRHTARGSAATVSYTHLDVYKRQRVYLLANIKSR